MFHIYNLNRVTINRPKHIFFLINHNFYLIELGFRSKLPNCFIRTFSSFTKDKVVGKVQLYRGEEIGQKPVWCYNYFYVNDFF